MTISFMFKASDLSAQDDLSVRPKPQLNEATQILDQGLKRYEAIRVPPDSGRGVRPTTKRGESWTNGRHAAEPVANRSGPEAIASP